MEEFYTIQGEGYHRSSLFYQIGGCDVGCHWCDVKRFECRIASANNYKNKGPNAKSTLIPCQLLVANHYVGYV
jgi:organic radical activating enzyme